MKATRGLIGAVGVGFGLWGLWLMRDFSGAQMVSMATWLVGGVLLHDAILAPITVGLGVLAARRLPGHFRSAVAIAFLVWATVTLAVFNVLSGMGGKPDNSTILDRPYLLSWVVLTGLLAGAAVVAALRHRRSTPVVTAD